MRTVNHYDVLGVDRQAPATQIKSHYRRLAKRYHPDLNPDNPQAAQRFREIHNAYEVLSDPDKRRNYDQTLTPSAGYAYTGPTRTRRRYDGRYRQPPRYNRPVSRPYQPRSDYSRYTLDLTLQELFKGVRRALVVGQTFTCGRCRGSGKLDSGATCGRCGGYGFVVSYRRMEVNIPPGMQPDMSIRVEVGDGQAEHPLLDAPVLTNISVTIQLCGSDPFEYRDRQLYITTEVPTQLLEEGGAWTIPAPEGGQLTFNIPAHTLSGTQLTIRKRGLRNGSSQRRGNLYCTVLAEAEKIPA